jgi:hypothetical protein
MKKLRGVNEARDLLLHASSRTPPRAWAVIIIPFFVFLENYIKMNEILLHSMLRNSFSLVVSLLQSFKQVYRLMIC